jgi:hypothetical protein
LGNVLSQAEFERGNAETEASETNHCEGPTIDPEADVRAGPVCHRLDELAELYDAINRNRLTTEEVPKITCANDTMNLEVEQPKESASAQAIRKFREGHGMLRRPETQSHLSSHASVF